MRPQSPVGHCTLQRSVSDVWLTNLTVQTFFYSHQFWAKPIKIIPTVITGVPAPIGLGPSGPESVEGLEKADLMDVPDSDTLLQEETEDNGGGKSWQLVLNMLFKHLPFGFNIIGMATLQVIIMQISISLCVHDTLWNTTVLLTVSLPWTLIPLCPYLKLVWPN